MQCPASYQATTRDRLGKVLPCPEATCGKADVVVSWDVVEGPAFEPHLYQPKSGSPRRHLSACVRDEDGKVEDCRCPVGAVA